MKARGPAKRKDAEPDAKPMTAPCIFCTLANRRIVAENTLAAAVLDNHPVSPGHTLIVPRRHAASFFGVTEAERNAMFALVDAAKAALDAEFRPYGYNVGLNDGAAAGQTVPHLHLHLHLIPRYAGDREDPRGGVRWIIPEKAKYWP
jgi:diadenosine tetraphosphate (Ap4A) HIT family hydrolase